MLAAVSHRFQNYSEGLNSCMCVTSEGEGEKQKRRNEQFVTFDGSKFANNNKRQMEDKKSAYF